MGAKSKSKAQLNWAPERSLSDDNVRLLIRAGARHVMVTRSRILETASLQLQRSVRLDHNRHDNSDDIGLE